MESIDSYLLDLLERATFEVNAVLLLVIWAVILSSAWNLRAETLWSSLGIFVILGVIVGAMLFGDLALFPGVP